jgi:hypothetical protein
VAEVHIVPFAREPETQLEDVKVGV